MNSDTWLVAVGAGRWQLPGIRAARAAGLKVLAVDANPEAPGFGAADFSMAVDIRDAARVVSSLEQSGLRLSGAAAFCNEAGMLTAAAIREHFDLPGPRAAVVKALTNKGVQRARWTDAGLPCPVWRVVRLAEDVPDVLASINGRAIFKPVDSAGSRGVTVIGKNEPWEQAFDAACRNSFSGEVIIESFIEGIEHTVETFTHGGQTQVLAITAKKKVPGTSNTVACELASAQLSDSKTLEVCAIVTKALASLGYTDGPGHTEFLLTGGGQIYLVESAGRGGGFMVADGIVPFSSGFDLARATALQAVGLDPGGPSPGPRKSVVLRFVPSRVGKVLSIRGFDAGDETEGVLCEPMVCVGQDLGAAASDGDRMAFILACGQTLEEALAKADEHEKKIRIVVGQGELMR